MNATDQSKFPTVVIIGGGFGGIQVAKQLADKPVEVILIDKHNYHTFQPLLYQVATGRLRGGVDSFSFRKNFEGQKNLRFRNTEVTRIDTESKVQCKPIWRNTLRLPGDSYRLYHQLFSAIKRLKITPCR
jgi:NADH dehydrogenase